MSIDYGCNVVLVGDFVNQILITGDEVIREPVKKEKKVLPINTIVIIYAISVIILGI